MDLPGRAEAETAAAFCELDRINRFFAFAHPFESVLPHWLGAKNCERMNILDIGAGTGLLGKTLTEWAGCRGWDWHFTNLDANALALKTGNQPDSVVGSALQLPFADSSFDLVVASQMTHHLTDGQIVTHWREAWRVTRGAMFVCDLHRNAGLYAMLWFGIDVLKCPNCGGRMKLIASIKERAVICLILGHLGLPSELPRFHPPRAPPQPGWTDFGHPPSDPNFL